MLYRTLGKFILAWVAKPLPRFERLDTRELILAHKLNGVYSFTFVKMRGITQGKRRRPIRDDKLIRGKIQIHTAGGRVERGMRWSTQDLYHLAECVERRRRCPVPPGQVAIFIVPIFFFFVLDCFESLVH